MSAQTETPTRAATKPPFETTTSAFLLLTAVAMVTLGGAMLSLLQVQSFVAAPMIFAAGGLTALVGIVLAVNDHPAHALMAGLLGPFVLWPMTMVILFAQSHAEIGWGLLAFGMLPVAFALASIRRRSAPKRSPARPSTTKTVTT
jgi:hypothetical protein